MKIIKYFKPTFLLLLLFTLSGQISAQVVQAKFGLTDKNGNVILEQVYDEVKPVYENWSVYMYRKGNKIGLYNFYDSTLYPCVYDQIKYDRRGYIIREGNKYGFIVGDWKFSDNSPASVITPDFDAVVFYDELISVKKNNFYATYSRQFKPEMIVPFIATNTLHYDSHLGYYYHNRDNKVLLRYDEKTTVWNKTEIKETAEVYFPLIVDADRLQGITIYNCKTAKRISYFPPPATGVSQIFNPYGRMIETTETIGDLKRVTFYDPFTTNAFFTCDLKKDQELICEQIDYHNPFMGCRVSIEVEKRRGMKFIDLGLMKDYNYWAYVQPRKRRIRPPLISIGGGGFHYEWFWSGR